MLDMIEAFVKERAQYTYLRLDGGTAMAHREAIVARFNEVRYTSIMIDSYNAYVRVLQCGCS